MEALNESIGLNQVAEITLAYRPKVSPSQRPKVSCSKEVYEVLLRFWNKDSLEYLEQFQVMLLSRGNRVLGIPHLADHDRTTGICVYLPVQRKRHPR